MKTLLLCLLVLLPLTDAFAQLKSGRHYANKAGAAKKRNQETANAINQSPAQQPKAPPAQPPSQSVQSQPGSNKARMMVPQKSAEEKQEIVQRTIEFQRKRAEKGDAFAQYDYGMRFLRGDGVEKNQETGLKWIRLSANQGNTLAKKQLEDIDKKESESVWSKDEETAGKPAKKKK